MPKKGRQVPDFIQAYKEYLAEVPGPPQFKDWAALWTLSAAMERRTWTITQGSQCFPNLYVMLIGPSGCGKGITIRTARNLVAALGSDRLGASSMTAAYVQQILSENGRSFINPVTKNGEPFNALNIVSAEMMVLFPAYDSELFGNLTDAWDCWDYSTGRIAKDRTAFLERVCVTALFATTPTHVHDLISKNAWHGGFMSRTIMVLGEAAERGSAFVKSQLSKELLDLYQRLKVTIKHISEMAGEFTWAPDVAEVFDEFYRYPGNVGGPPIPLHPNLATYCIRRHQQLEKIMMCHCAARTDDKVLTMEDYNYAHSLLLDTEAVMPDVFKGANLGSPHDKANQILFQLWTWQCRNKDRAISGERIFEEIHKKINFFSEAQHLYKLLINSGKLRKVPELKLTEKQRNKSTDWFHILSGKFEEDLLDMKGED